MPWGDGRSIEVFAQFHSIAAREFGLRLRVGRGEETLIGFDSAAGSAFVDRTHAGQRPGSPAFAGRRHAPLRLGEDARLELRILVDWSSVEVFVNDGEAVISEQIFPAADSDALSVYAIGGSVAVDAIDVWQLEPADGGVTLHHASGSR